MVIKSERCQGNALEEQDRFAGFLNHLPFKVKHL